MSLRVSSFVCAALVSAGLLSGCGRGGGGGVTPPGNIQGTQLSEILLARQKVKHIVIITQENRSFDNMFNGFPGADTVQSGPIHTGSIVPLTPQGIEAGYNISHQGKDFPKAYDKGKLDGFDLVAAGNVGSAHGFILVPPNPEYAFVPPSEAAPDWQLAHEGALADRMFQSNVDASYVAHQYLIRGNASSTVDNPTAIPWGCDTPAGGTVSTLQPGFVYGPQVSPCFDGTTIGDELQQKGLTWHYYAPQVANLGQPGFNYGGVWSAYGAIKHIRCASLQEPVPCQTAGPLWGISQPLSTNSGVHWPNTDILKDVPNGQLATVTWITPNIEWSDHPSCFTDEGPSWVASIVNMIGQSQFYNDTVVIVQWDDAGGWYDHVTPPLLDFDGPGCRIPLCSVSPWSKLGQVIRVQFDTGRSLKFIESVYNLPSISASDTRANNLIDMLDFTKPVQPFKPVAQKYPASFFINAPSKTYDPPDNV